MSILAEAKRLRGLGLNVMPVLHGHKDPTITKRNGTAINLTWAQYQSSMVPESSIDQWFSKDTGMGVICGEVSGFLCVLDFDVEGSYEAWKGLYPDLAQILPTDRRGGRYHVYFRSESLTLSSTFSLKGEGERCGELIAERKFVVMPPTVHPEGETRVWVNPIDGPIPVLSLEDLGVEVPTRTVISQADKVQVERPPIWGQRPGDWFDEYFTIEQVLLPHGWQIRYERNGKQYWRRPGEGEDDHCAVVGFSDKNPKWLWVFSPNAHPLEPDVLYSPFKAYATLNHGGDFSEAAKEIAKKFGTFQNYLPPSLKENEKEASNFASISFTSEYTQVEGEEVDFPAFEELFVPMPQYLAKSRESGMDWVVQDLLPATYLAVLGGVSKSGKSCFATALAWAVATGNPFMGLATQEGPVLWLAVEESETERSLVLRNYEEHPNLHISHYKFCLEKPSDLFLLRQAIRRTGARLVIVDPLYSATEAESLSDGRQARKSLEGLKALCAQEKVAALVLHHLNKNVGAGMVRERLADSNQILATASMDLLMDFTEDGDGGRWITLKGRGRGAFCNRDWTIYSSGEASYELRELPEGSGRSSVMAEERILKALRDSPQGLTKSELVIRTSMNGNTLGNRLTGMKDRGLVIVVGKNGKADVYGLSENADAA